MYTGPKIIRDGLVFGYDADDRSTRFYKGEPTANKVTNPAFVNGTNNWSFTSTSDSEVDIAEVKTVNGYRYFHHKSSKSSAGVKDRLNQSATFTINTLSNFTVSFDFWENPNNDYSISFYGRGSCVDDTVYNEKSLTTNGTTVTKTTLSDGWVKHVYQVQTNWFTGTGNQFRFAVYPGFSNTGLMEYKIRNIQVEEKSHVTPFVIGTRSSTEGLLDLTGNTTIDLSNVSFDSTAHPTFDGTDDKIDLGDNFDLNDHFTDGGNFSIEAVIYMRESPSLRGGIFCNQKYSTETDPGGFGLAIPSNNTYVLMLTNSNPTSYQGLAGIPFNQDQYHHICFTFDSSSGKVVSYSNGSEYTSVTNSSYSWNIPTDSTRTRIGANTQGGWDNYINMDIPVLKVYNKTLTSTEIQQNYRAYKNRFGI